MSATSAEQIQTALIDRLNALQWQKPKSVTLRAFKAGRARLLSDLRYLTEDQLGEVVREAEMLARAYKCWPAPALIIAKAHLLYPNPDIEREREAGILRYMRCKVGRAALDGDYAVELLAELRAKGPGGVSASVMSVGRWCRKADERRSQHNRAVARDDAGEIAFWDRRIEEAREMVVGADAGLSA